MTDRNGPSATTNIDTLAQKAADQFLKAFGSHPGFRLAHAKGIVCEGVFQPAPGAAELSRAAHFKGGPVPLVARFSNATGLPTIPDNDPYAGPRGFALRFKLPGGGADIVSNSKRGFIAATPEGFVGFFDAALATTPQSPHPTPLESFLAAHPASAAYAARTVHIPASYAGLTYFGNNAFIFVDARGRRQAVRYEIEPVAGEQHIDAGAAAAKPSDYLGQELRARLSWGPVEFRLRAQLAESGDPTNDVTRFWPDERRRVDLGSLRLTSIDPKSAESERGLIFDPVNLTEGIELSDDPLPMFRSKVYSISFAHRRPAGR